MSKRRKNGARRPANTAPAQKNVPEQREEALKMSEQAKAADEAKEPGRIIDTDVSKELERIIGADAVKEPEQTIDADAAKELKRIIDADTAEKPEPAAKIEMSGTSEQAGKTDAEPEQKPGESEKSLMQTAGHEEETIYSGEETAEHPETEQIVLPEKKRAKATKKAQAKKAEKVKDDEAPADQKEKKSPGISGVLLRKIFFCVSLGVFSYALSGLLFLMWGYYTSQREYSKLNEGTVVIGTTAAPESQEQNPGLVVDLPGNNQQAAKAPYLEISVDERKLKALNQDYAFYIVIPDTHIQYPVVQGEDNNHYLRYTYSNQENTAGAIALDYRTDRSTYLQSFNTIISGHNRQDGTMFSDLASYKEQSFRDAHPYIYIVMGDKEYVYEMFAFYAMEPVAVCYNPNTADDIYLDFINKNNTYRNDIAVTKEDHIITLYTCNEDSSMRYLCHAVLREVYDLK